MMRAMSHPAKSATPEEITAYLAATPRAELLKAIAKLTPRQLVEVVFPWVFNHKPATAERLAGATGVFRFELEDFRDGVWTIELADGRFAVRPGEPPRVDFGVIMHIDDFEDIQRFELEPKDAFLKGKIRTQGDMGAAFRIGTLLYGEKIKRFIR